MDFGLDLDKLIKIIVADLLLSGDNAVVIGMAARRLPLDQRRRAIALGAGGAIGLRIIFTAMVTLLLAIPLLQALGGVLLLWIAFKLLRQDDEEHKIKEGSNLAEAARTIILADVIMSFDNILAVGAAAHGEIGYLLFGLALSMPLILFGSSFISALLNRRPWLAYLGSAVLVYAAVELIIEDPRVSPFLPHTTAFHWGTILATIAVVLGLAYWLNTHHAPFEDDDAPRGGGGREPDPTALTEPATGAEPARSGARRSAPES